MASSSNGAANEAQLSSNAATIRSSSRSPHVGSRAMAWLHAHRTIREALLLLLLYIGYSLARTFADDQIAPAMSRAARIVDLEASWNIAIESSANLLFVNHNVLGIAAAFWYASAHYIVTALVVVWLFIRRPEHYAVARRALVLATLVALVFYLTTPTAPPRFEGGFVDVMLLHSDIGWWGASASAPEGLGALTNQLAAFPSMHVGWALWVALVISSAATSLWVKVMAYAYPTITAIVVVGTANHWVLDVVMGGALVALSWWMCMRAESRREAKTAAQSAAAQTATAEPPAA